MHSNLTIFFLFPVSPFFFSCLTIPPFFSCSDKRFQAQNDKIRIISSFSDVDYEEQECIYEEVEGEMSQEFVEDSKYKSKEVEVKEVRTL